MNRIGAPIKLLPSIPDATAGTVPSPGALEVDLDEEALAEIEAAVPAGAAAGERYDPRLLATMDSERSRGARDSPS